ncbi:MAG: hypothetical protein ACRENN_02980 [Candidatus Eiseniibacteriota bacterium]
MQRETALIFPPELPGGRRATLTNIWPNEDGRFWSYEIEQRTWDMPQIRYYANPADVPPLPRLDAIVELLRRHPAGKNPVAAAAGYTMQFQGLRTTQSGATGQNLVTRVIPPVEIGPAAAIRAPLAPPGAAGGFMASLRTARPDLAPKIAARGPQNLAAAPAIAQDVQPPLFLFGYAWVKTPEYIGSYGDLNTDLAWKYLDADLRPGSTFRMQLVPDLADNVFLYARVIREGITFSRVGSIRSAIDVLYVVDFGASGLTDVNGDVIGYNRMYSYGTITYAPGVGPIASYERGLVQTGLLLDPGTYDQRIQLKGTAWVRSFPN